jgi:ubiquinone/menaquinone biosynthesis C-methylase UbiE
VTDRLNNPFTDEAGVAMYDRARPYFHSRIAKRLAEVLPKSARGVALDVACGTGQSTVALQSIVDRVVGLDASRAMLRQRRSPDTISYVQGSAEQMPFTDGTFDLVSVSLALHWFDRVAFLHEARRLLRSESWLVVYDLNFAARMKENVLLGEWTARYRQLFPHPSRNKNPLSEEELTAAGFHEVLSETFVHLEVFDLDRLMSYLMTQSNVLHAIHEGRETELTARSWLRETLSPLFTGPTGTFEYDGWLKVWQKIA